MSTSSSGFSRFSPAGRKLTAAQGLALMVLVAAVFLLINRQAYQNFFHDDSFDNMGWTNLVGIDTFRDGVLTWKFSPNNFRPVGHYYFRIMHQIADYNFPVWVGALHLFHLIGVWMLWLILRRLGASPAAAATGLLFYAVHMSAFLAYWRPMYDFDVLCGMFTLLCLYLYMRGGVFRLLLSVVSFWLAYKAKEMAVAVPAILLLYEWWFGGRRWWRVLPFAAISASFATQAYFRNSKTDNPYTLRLTPAAFQTCAKFYSKYFFFFNYSGILLLLFPLLKRDKRVLFGLWMTLCLMGPMLFLPGRLFETYLYLPLAGVAVAMTFVLEGRPKWVLAAVALVWLGANVYMLRRKAPHELEVARITKTYFSQVFEMARKHPYVRAVTFRNAPPEMASYGIEAMFRQALKNPDAIVHWAEKPEAREASKLGNFAATVWDHENLKLLYRVRREGEPYLAGFKFTGVPPAWQLNEGWYAPDPKGFCYTKPKAVAELRLPESPKEFFLQLKLDAEQIPKDGAATVAVSVGGVVLPSRQYRKEGTYSEAWPLDQAAIAKVRTAADAKGDVKVEITTTPPYQETGGEARLRGVGVFELALR